MPARGPPNTISGMSELSCSGCGAPLALPPDLTAIEAPCGYCPTRTPLPVDIVEIRLREHAQLAEQEQQATAQAQIGATAKRTTSFVMWIVILSVVAPLLITGVVLAFVFSATSRALHHLPTHAPRHR